MPDSAETRRLFRADTPADAFCAAIVAEYLPAGHDVLAISSDKRDVESSEDWEFALRAAAGAYPWTRVQSVSGLPLAKHVYRRYSPIRRLRDTVSTLSELERALSTEFDELYLSLPHHPDVAILKQLMPRARTFYYPHSFGSLLPSEIVVQARFLSPQRRPRVTALHRVVDAAKAAAFGARARPLRSLELDGVFTFNAVAPWSETIRLEHLLSRSRMLELFEKLPDTVRHHFGALADAAGPCGVLFLSVPGQNRPIPDADELTTYRDLAGRVLDASESRSLVVKPHPRGSRKWGASVISHLRSDLGFQVTDASRYAELPAEVVLAGFDVEACIGLASAALLSFSRIHRAPALFSQEAQRALWTQQDFSEELMSAWLAAADDLVTVVD